METRGRESGFTLMELTVAMGLTVAALAIAVTAINALSSMRETSELLTDQNQSLRQSLNLVTRDLIVSGRQIPLGGIAIPSGAGSVPVIRPSPVGTTRFFPAGSLAIPAVAPGDAVGPPVNGTPTDIVSMMMVDTNPVCPPPFPSTVLEEFPLTNITPAGDAVTVNPGTQIVCGNGGIRPGNLIMILGTLQMVTGVAGQTIAFANGDPMGLNQNGAAAGTLFTFNDPVTGYPPATATRVVMVTYYIDTTSNPARPQLMRRINMDLPDRAIGIGIENLQISYDLDVGGGRGIANVAAPGNPNQIRKINVFVSGRSRRTSPQSQQFLRTSLSTQVNVRNLSLVDRYE